MLAGCGQGQPANEGDVKLPTVAGDARVKALLKIYREPVYREDDKGSEQERMKAYLSRQHRHNLAEDELARIDPFVLDLEKQRERESADAARLKETNEMLENANSR